MELASYERAKEIEKQIETLEKLIKITSTSYNKFFLIKRFLFLSSWDQSDVVKIEDAELRDIIRQYCRERITALNAELESL